MGFINKFILPRQVDFNAALQAQALETLKLVHYLYDAFIKNDQLALTAISSGAEQARALKQSNMKELLDVFIAPYDKESIYRIITQLDWIALSINHFRIEAQAYSVQSLQGYQSIFQLLMEMGSRLEEGIAQLSSGRLKSISENTSRIHDQYDRAVVMCAESMANLLQQDDCKKIMVYRDLLAQLKEIARRIHITANTLEDMMIKAQ